MICTHCGKEIQNGITFCPYCGSTVNNAKENTKMKKHNPAKVLVSIAAVAVVAAGGWAFANRTPTIDVSKYMTLSADGYNTVGKLNIDFDTDKLEQDYGKQITTRFKKQMKNLKDDTFGLSSLTASLYDGYEADLFAETCATGAPTRPRTCPTATSSPTPGTTTPTRPRRPSASRSSTRTSPTPYPAWPA